MTISTNSPIISVIIPVYNREDFLEPAIKSVRAQAFDAIELIIVDDGSHDNSAEKARQLAPEAIVLERENGGPGAARNTGLEVARGEYIAFLDVDDVWPEGKLTRQLERLECDPTLDFILGRTQFDILEGGRDLGITYEDQERGIVTFFQFGAALYRARAFERIGNINEELEDSEDHDWFLRAKEAGLNWVCEPEIGVIYRRHPGNMTQPRPLAQTSLFEVIAGSLARRRDQAGASEVAKLECLTDRQFGQEPS